MNFKSRIVEVQAGNSIDIGEFLNSSSKEMRVVGRKNMKVDFQVQNFNATTFTLVELKMQEFILDL